MEKTKDLNNKERIEDLIDKTTGHFKDCKWVNKPNRLGLRPLCWYKEKYHTTTKCGVHLSVQCCFFEEEGKLYGMCTNRSGHWRKYCNTKSPYKWASHLSTCANRICDYFGIPTEGRLKINKDNIESLLGIPGEYKYNHIMKTKTKNKTKKRKVVEKINDDDKDTDIDTVGESKKPKNKKKRAKRVKKDYDYYYEDELDEEDELSDYESNESDDDFAMDMLDDGIEENGTEYHDDCDEDEDDDFMIMNMLNNDFDHLKKNCDSKNNVDEINKSDIINMFKEGLMDNYNNDNEPMHRKIIDAIICENTEEFEVDELGNNENPVYVLSSKEKIEPIKLLFLDENNNCQNNTKLQEISTEKDKKMDDNNSHQKSIKVQEFLTEKDKRIDETNTSCQRVDDTVIINNEPDKTIINFCGDCGTKRINGKKFCVFCGVKLTH